jgi:sugar diacid utilization regulator
VTVIACRESDAGRGLLKALRGAGFGRRTANGMAVGVGVGLDKAQAAGLPESLEEARLALEFASPARPLLHFSAIDLPEFLIRQADRIAFRLIPEWTRHFAAAGEGGQAAELARTIRVFTECSLNVKQTARRLGVHTNTVYFRLNRIDKLTGIDPRTFSGASLLITALKLVETHRRQAIK